MVKNNFAISRKTSRFYSPPLSPKNSKKESLIIEKYREIKNFALESEVKLHQLYGILKDSEGDAMKNLLRYDKLGFFVK